MVREHDAMRVPWGVPLRLRALMVGNCLSCSTEHADFPV